MNQRAEFSAGPAGLESTDVDVLIVGGGLVGSSLAIALDGCGLRVALVEAAAPVAPVAAGSPNDERNLALAHASVTALSVLGVWPALEARAQPIRRVHVSRSGEFGSVRLNAMDFGHEQLGAVIPARELGDALFARLSQCDKLHRFAPASVSDLIWNDAGVDATLQQGGQLRRICTRLLVGADGTQSLVRTSAGIGSELLDYQQSLFVCSVQPERPMDGCAYERFGDDGPVAMLPLAAGRAGLVLSTPADAAAHVAQLGDAAFVAFAQERFGWRLGRLSRPGRRSQHAIRRVLANRLVARRCVLVGNAAQTIHPIGAQGFNLGLRDALCLAEALIDSARCGTDPGAQEMLAAYALRRQDDRSGTLAFSDSLLRLACNPARPLKPLRSLGMALLDGFAPFKRHLVQRGMGFRGPPTAYALGRLP